jgi:inorganic triphosphatase YgiF
MASLRSIADKALIFSLSCNLRAPILEIELELKEGRRERLLDLSERLQVAFPLTPGTGSKYARGLSLFKKSGGINFPPAGEYLLSLSS